MKRILSIALVIALMLVLTPVSNAAPPIISSMGMSVRENSKTETSINVTMHIDTTFGLGLSDYGVQWSQAGTVIGTRSYSRILGSFMDVTGADFTLTITGLTPGTEYVVCGYADQGGQRHLTDGVTSITLGTSPVPTSTPTPTPTPTPKPTPAPTTAPSNAAPPIISGMGMSVRENNKAETSINITLHIDTTFGLGLSDYGVQWSQAGTVIGTRSYSGILGSYMDVSSADFTLTIANLTPGTEYFICGYADQGGQRYLSDGVTSVTLGTSPIPAPKPTPTPTTTGIKVTGVKTQSTLYLVKGKTATLPAAIQPYNAADKGVTWKSANTKIATVNAKGKVKGVKAGKTTITVSTSNGKKAKCTVNVVGKATAIKSVAKLKAVTLNVGKTQQVKPKLNPAKATGIVLKYKTSNSKVARIDAAGVITALKKGKSTITVTAGKKMQKFTLTVK